MRDLTEKEKIKLSQKLRGENQPEYTFNKKMTTTTKVILWILASPFILMLVIGLIFFPQKTFAGIIMIGTQALVFGFIFYLIGRIIYKVIKGILS